ncbi:hypothetical protein H2200_006147 [Cladophialophora chaetospira]|uniref:Protein RTA1 n=1 Tax=Cladophialophora chaetospira TaxID=386627 RepID=A0AA38XAI1_9EURO|nr:hypothetical protein H2200_006147 [Cladophialophora chaetospira]
MSSDSEPHFKFYHYDPSLAGACVLTIAFGVSTIWHLVLIAKHKTWYFIPLLIGGIFELIGYAARGISHGQAPHPTIAPYVIQTLLILVAPALFAATIYMILGRIIVSVNGESYSLIKKRWLTKTFVTSDVISFLVQLGGGGLMASSHASTAQTGSHIVLAGLIIQILLFGFFVAVAGVFHRRLLVRERALPHDLTLPWQKILYVLYLASVFIMIRSIVRVAEFVQGFEGSIIRHEVYLYVFDALPMLAVMGVLGVWYPGQYLGKVTKVSSVDDGESAMAEDGELELERTSEGRK